MANDNLIARVLETETEDGSFLVRSPAVGVVARLPEVGVYLNPMQGFLSLRIVGRQHTVQLPRHVHGHVAERFLEGIHVPVEFNQPLFRLEVRLDLASVEEAGDDGGAGTDASEDDLITVTAPSAGLFYRRPKPGSPPYVEEGSAVAKGTVLGLVEAMKCFNQIVYGGPGLPEAGTVVAVRAEDASEVEFGTPLFSIRASE